MLRLPPHLAPLGYSPRRYLPLSTAPVLGMGERLTDLREMQLLFANGEQGGYWPADPQYLYEDSAGTIPASVNGVCGLWANNVPGKPSAIQATTAYKPYMILTPLSRKYRLNANTNNSTMVATFSGSLGSTCTIATVNSDGVIIKENQTVGTTYSVAQAWFYNSDTLVINRALTVVEKALVTRHFLRNKPTYGSVANQIPQLSGYYSNTETPIDWSSVTSFNYTWNRGALAMTTFPFINTRNFTSYFRAWYGCSNLTEFFPLNSSKVTDLDYAWSACSSLTSFPLIDTSKVTNFNGAWNGCSGLTSFPTLDTGSATSMGYTWGGCSKLTALPLINVSTVVLFRSSWFNCVALTTFPASFFDTWIGVPAANCFLNAWYNCTSLTETSVQNILVSIAASGQSAPATGTEITLNGAPLLTVIQANSTIMAAVTTLKSRNWTPTYKGTNL